MSIQLEAPRTGGVVAELVGVQDQLRSLGQTLWAAREHAELSDTVAQLEAVRACLDAVELKVVRELEATNAVTAAGWASTQDFVTAVAGGHKATGPAVVRLAKAVAEPVLAPVGDALSQGWLSATQAQVIERAVDALLGDPDLRARARRAPRPQPEHHRRPGRGRMDQGPLLGRGRGTDQGQPDPPGRTPP